MEDKFKESDDLPLDEARSLAKNYAQQLDDIGRTLVKAGEISEGDIARDGVRFAVKRRWDLADLGQEHGT